MQKWAYRLAAIAAISLSSLAAHADTVYTYTGNAFTISDAPYDSSDSVTGSFTVASPLAANMVLPSNFTWGSSNVNWTSFSFSDGFDPAITNLTVNPEFALLAVGTDSSGDITSWYVSFVIADFSSQLTTTTFGHPIDYGLEINGGAAQVDNNPGTWSSSTSTDSAATPEPSSLALLGTGLAGMCGAIRRRVRI